MSWPESSEEYDMWREEEAELHFAVTMVSIAWKCVELDHAGYIVSEGVVKLLIWTVAMKIASGKPDKFAIKKIWELYELWFLNSMEKRDWDWSSDRLYGIWYSSPSWIFCTIVSLTTEWRGTGLSWPFSRYLETEKNVKFSNSQALMLNWLEKLTVPLGLKEW